MYMSHKILLICIPYAGGNKYAFTGLKSWLPVNMEMLTLELPGRAAGGRAFTQRYTTDDRRPV